MTKLIEWTLSEPMPNRETHHVLRVRRYHGGLYNEINATPADLVAALAAMPMGDRETVLSASWNGIVMRGDYEHVVAERNEATARAEKAEHRVAELLDHLGEVSTQRNGETFRANNAERERDRMAAEFGCCHGELPDDGEIARIRRERDEARLELDRARASLDVVRHDLAGTRQELREAREDRDSLRTRLIAAESAAAAREPKEYPLAEGSRIQGETLVTAGGVRMSIRGQVTHCRGPSLDVELKCRERYWLPLRDVLALAHRRGLL